MGRRIEVPETQNVDADLLHRRYRRLEIRLACACGDLPEATGSVQAVAEQLRAEAKRVDDPAERLALAERAYLSVFSRLPYPADAAEISS